MSKSILEFQREQLKQQENEVVEGEMLPVESPNFHQVELPPVVEVSIQKAVELVEFSKKFGQVAVICAAQAGAEFSNIKDQCERGEWMKVLKQLPFGKSTVYKYIKVADEFQLRLSQGEDAIDLLTLPSPQELISGDHSELVSKINTVTGEQTLRQLYFEWGICKAPKALGGARPVTDHTPKELVELRKQDANESVGALCTDLQKVCIGESRSVNLADIEFLKLLEGDLMDSLKNVRELINAG